MWFLLLIPAFLAMFVAIWCLVLTILAKVGGWDAMALRYRCDDQPAGKAFDWQSARIGWVSYNRVLTLIPTHEGLYLAARFVFRVGHPPLLLPWEELHNFEQKQALALDHIKMDVGKPRITTLYVPRKVIESKPATTS